MSNILNFILIPANQLLFCNIIYCLFDYVYKEKLVMFEKNPNYERYVITDFTYEEELYEKYMTMRRITSELENKKYSISDNFKDQEMFKQGFLAGVKVMSALLLDI